MHAFIKHFILQTRACSHEKAMYTSVWKHSVALLGNIT